MGFLTLCYGGVLSGLFGVDVGIASACMCLTLPIVLVPTGDYLYSRKLILADFIHALIFAPLVGSRQTTALRTLVNITFPKKSRSGHTPVTRHD